MPSSSSPISEPDEFLVGLQNGMTANIIADVVGPSRTLGCVPELSSHCFDPGRGEAQHGSGQNLVCAWGLHPATHGREEDVAAILRHAGKVEITPHILAAKYMKLVLNSMTLGTIAMTGGELSDRQPEGMQDLMMRLGSDSLKVGEALGHPIVPIFGLTSAEIEGSNNLLMKLVDKVNHDIGPGRGANTTLQDHIKGRLSEVDLINGLVVEEGRRARNSDPGERDAGRGRASDLRRRAQTRPCESRHRARAAQREGAACLSVDRQEPEGCAEPVARGPLRCGVAVHRVRLGRMDVRSGLSAGAHGDSSKPIK